MDLCKTRVGITFMSPIFRLAEEGWAANPGVRDAIRNREIRSGFMP
jgi:hypothetical protein